MEGRSLLLLFSGVLVLCLPNSAAVDTIAANQAIRDGDTIVSAGERYELGFFSPGKSKNRYLGIWYKKISKCTVVWVANRKKPLTNKLGVLKVSSEGILLLLSGDTVIWSSNSSISVRKINPMAQLLDTGNLVVRNGDSNDQVNFIWQSFDYPSDTLLSGMKLGKDLVTGIDRQLTSWMSPDDPSPGLYVMWVDTNGFPQVFERQGSVIQLRIGPWNGLRLGGLPMVKPNPIFSSKFVFNDKEVYYKYELLSSVVQMMRVNWDGDAVQLNWVDRMQEWIVFVTASVGICGRYALCGSFASCSMIKQPLCSCLEGFEPRRPEEWNRGDWSGGCQRKKPLDCSDGDHFKKVSGVRFPDTRRSWYDWNITLRGCELACKSKCNCTAYANLDIRNGGSGCLLWFNELMDIREYDENQDLCIRMAASELVVLQSGFNKKIRLLVVVLSASSILLVLLGVSLALNICSKKRRWSHMKRQGVQQEDLDQLPFFSLYEIAKATNYFSIDNKIGEGGFGPVYKGILEDGQRVAVKRLSKTSEQGLDEFKNEVVCIAKLQHRNLVRLLGYCIHRDEMILIYEYMANKSLDSVLFDEAKSSMLQWPQRFCIIHGIARGILYLHQDSRLQIIHRDLKASNVLLDDEMNPRISDFGLARRFVGYDTTAQTKNVAGTYGYMPPEYALHGRFSVKSDVFGFGVLVLEIVSGKKNREFCFEDQSGNLLGHAWRLYKEGRSLELVSASIRDSCVISQVLRSIHVGLLCVQHHPQDRPAMSSVVLMLGSDVALDAPKQPAFFTEKSWRELSTSSVDEATITLLDAR